MYQCSNFGSPKLRSMRTVVIMLTGLFLFSCGKEQCRKGIPEAATDQMGVLRLEGLISDQSVTEIQNTLRENQTFSELFLHRSQYPIPLIEFET